MFKLEINISYWEGCNCSIVPEIGDEEGETPKVSRENIMLWHQRMEHIKEEALQVQHGKYMVEGMSNFSMDFYLCEHCLYGKQNQVRFSSGATRAEGML